MEVKLFELFVYFYYMCDTFYNTVMKSKNARCVLSAWLIFIFFVTGLWPSSTFDLFEKLIVSHDRLETYKNGEVH